MKPKFQIIFGEMQYIQQFTYSIEHNLELTMKRNLMNYRLEEQHQSNTPESLGENVILRDDGNLGKFDSI
jgi:hypothetical protein